MFFFNKILFSLREVLVSENTEKISHAAFRVFLEIGVDTALGSMSSVVSSVYIIQVYFQDKEKSFSSLPFELTKVSDFQDWSAKSLR